MSSDDQFKTSNLIQEQRVEAFAKQVLETISQSKPMRQRPESLRRRLQEATDWLVDTVLNDSSFDPKSASEQFARFGLSLPEVIDGCVLQAARRTGQRWVDDTASFAQVSLAGARLYAFCKFLNDEWKPRKSGQRGPTLLVLTAPGEQHMLGAVVLTSQLRRRGCSVQLLTGLSEEVTENMQTTGFDAILISCSSSQTLDNVQRFVARIRKRVDNPPRIVVGGPIAEEVNLGEVAGADLVTSNIDVALAGLEGEKDVDLLAAQ